MFKIIKIASIPILLTISFLNAQSLQELQKMKNEYEKIKKSNDLPKDLELQQNQGSETNLPKKTYIKPFNDDRKINFQEEESSKHFGYDFFTKRDSVYFWENLPVISDYILGPGDELIISLWGETQLRETYKISRDGKIYDDKVGLLILSGLSLDQAKSFLTKKFGSIYSTLTSTNPSTFIDISIGELKSININFVGEVKFPGIYSIHPFSNIINGLIQAGGVDTTGSLRKVQIKRQGKIVEEIDLYKFFLEGSISSPAFLKDQDIVIVNPRSSIIYIDSSVVRPAIYEANESESVFDMIKFAGGLTLNASNQIGVSQLISTKEKKQVFNKYVTLNESKKIKAKNVTSIVALRLPTSVRKVNLIGQVKEPGEYFYYDGMKVSDLLDLGSGFDDKTFWNTVFQDRAEIVRRNPNSKYEEVIEINLGKLMSGDVSENPLLQNLDKFVVHSNLNFFEKENVLILGEVNVPGSYPLIHDNESLTSLIKRAGGLTQNSLVDGISIFRDTKRYFNDEKLDDSPNTEFNQKNEELENLQKSRKARVAWKNYDFSLMPGDSIVVKEKTATVLVSGAVYNSGIQEFSKGRSINYYINLAGGLTELANKDGIIIRYPNGIVRPKRWYSSPKVTEGCIIIINSKPIEQPFDITQFATNWTSIVSSMITAVVLAQQLSSN